VSLPWRQTIHPNSPGNIILHSIYIQDCSPIITESSLVGISYTMLAYHTPCFQALMNGMGLKGLGMRLVKV